MGSTIAGADIANTYIFNFFALVYLTPLLAAVVAEGVYLTIVVFSVHRLQQGDFHSDHHPLPIQLNTGSPADALMVAEIGRVPRKAHPAPGHPQ